MNLKLLCNSIQQSEIGLSHLSTLSKNEQIEINKITKVEENNRIPQS